MKRPGAKQSKSNDKTQKNTKRRGIKELKSKPTSHSIGLNNHNAMAASEHLSVFLREFQSSNRLQLSSLELESIKDTCMIMLSDDIAQDPSNLALHMKPVFDLSWKEELCDNYLLDGKIDPGSPCILIISASAARTLEMLRGVRSLTRECPAAKLFSKHIKIDEQVLFLRSRVNIAAGTPNRIKRLLDMEALGLSRLKVAVLDMHVDVKGYSLLTLPQIREEFWDLYRNHLHGRLPKGDLRICLFGLGRGGRVGSG